MPACVAGARLEHDLVALAASLRTTSGTSATRRSPSTFSLGTPILTSAASYRRGDDLAPYPT